MYQAEAAGKRKRLKFVLQMSKDFIDDPAVFDDRDDFHLLVASGTKDRISFILNKGKNLEPIRKLPELRVHENAVLATLLHPSSKNV